MPVSNTAFIDSYLLDRLPPAALRPSKAFAIAELGLAAQLNAAEALFEAARRAGMEGALGGDRERWTLDRLEDESRRIAALLRQHYRLVPGNRVLLRAPNRPMLVASLLGVHLAGLVAVASPPGLKAAELQPVLRDARPDLVITTAEGLAAVGTAAAVTGLSPALATLDADDPSGIPALSRRQPPLMTAVATHADDPALMLFTSGTTGRPKATLHSHADIIAMTRSFGGQVYRVAPDDVVIGSPSLAFAYGYGVLFACTLAQGACLHLIERPHSGALADALASGGPSVLITSPTAYRKLLARPGGLDAGRLRLAVSAGEYLAPALRRAFEAQTGVPLLDALGSTEMLGPYVASRSGTEAGALGSAVPGYRLKALDAADRTLPPGATGRLAVQGPTGCCWLHEEDARASVRDGWMLTNDLAALDAAGNVHFKGRADDMILSAGHTIAAAEVEAALALHPAVAECAVLGAPDAERGQMVLAIVRAAEGQAPGEALGAVLLDELKTRLASWKCPRRIVFCAQLPHTLSGKIRRSALLALLEEEVKKRGLAGPDAGDGAGER